MTEIQKDYPALIAYPKWIREIGVSSTTGWRWIKKGWIHPVNIAGRLYVTGDEIQKFHAKAGRGELAKQPAGAAAISQGHPAKATD
jgi:hypothetical protein